MGALVSIHGEQLEVGEVMTALTARQILHREYGHAPNFMTPDVLEVGKLHPCVAFEVSKGRGFDDELIYGVSVVRLRCDGTTKRLTRLSELFFSRRQADWHVPFSRNWPARGSKDCPAAGAEVVLRSDCYPAMRAEPAAFAEGVPLLVHFILLLDRLPR